MLKRLVSTITTNVQVNNVIDERACIRGDFEFEGTLRIDGIIHGKLKTNGEIIIGKTAQINADISTRTIIVNGEVNGNIIAEDSVVLLSSARITGNISSQTLRIDEGAFFFGKFKRNG